MPNLTLADFVARWKASTLSERAGYQQHFRDLCEVLGEPHPAEVDQSGEEFTFEKGGNKTTGEAGWADVWRRGYFGWEYKGKHKNLLAAYQQLVQYKDALQNPPLLVVCDFDRFEVRTNFNNAVTQLYAFTLDDLLRPEPTLTCAIPPINVLRAAFQDANRLKPNVTPAQVTEAAAKKFSVLAESLRKRGVPSERAAHFLMRLLFCLFGEDVGLLPNKLFARLIESARNSSARFTDRLKELFRAMSAPGGHFGVEEIPYFNGGLFSDDEAFDLSGDDLRVLGEAASLDWGSIEPAIFGTLFERSLDPDKRSQLGAHYTSADDISLIVEPVLMAPLRRRWVEVKAKAEPQAAKIHATRGGERTKAQKALRQMLGDFLAEISAVKVLDPACGSGNFLYVALKRLLDLEQEVSVYASENKLTGFLPLTSPENLYGIEINVYAHELASVVVWIGFLQWQHEHSTNFGSVPILRPLNNIRRMDAVLDYDADGKPTEPQWPKAEVIIGNPPFLGDKKMREGLGDKYVDDLRALYADRVPGGADFVTYWHERARAQIESGRAKRAGLLATNSIRMIGNRKVLERVKATGDIFMAWSDREWVLDGANVRVSMVGFDGGQEQHRVLDGNPVSLINADLTAGLNLTAAVPLPENANLCFLGVMKGGPFDIDSETAQRMLDAPANPNGRTNADVVRRRLGGMDVVRNARNTWVVDFGQMSEGEAALYEMPFEYVRQHVKPIRDSNRRKHMRERWWIHGEARPGMRRAIRPLKRCIVTPEVSKHRVFVWMPTDVVPDHKLHVIAREDDYFFGALQSRPHVVWSLRLGSTLEDRPSYNSETVFSTFPFPWHPGKEPKGDARVEAIATAARDLVRKRDDWLNPAGASDAELRKRTLTHLYNHRPTWLADAHRALDNAVLAAYGWPESVTDDEILSRLLELNQQRASAENHSNEARHA